MSKTFVLPQSSVRILRDWMQSGHASLPEVIERSEIEIARVEKDMNQIRDTMLEIKWEMEALRKRQADLLQRLKEYGDRRSRYELLVQWAQTQD